VFEDRDGLRAHRRSYRWSAKGRLRDCVHRLAPRFRHDRNLIESLCGRGNLQCRNGSSCGTPTAPTPCALARRIASFIALAAISCPSPPLLSRTAIAPASTIGSGLASASQISVFNLVAYQEAHHPVRLVSRKDRACTSASDVTRASASDMPRRTKTAVAKAASFSGGTGAGRALDVLS
jgi:hypothetical protein